MSSQVELSIVLPAYREGGHISESLVEIDQHARRLGVEYELICIDDGSPDDTWAKLEEASSHIDTLHIIRLSRNFGKEAAMLAGLEAATGDAVVVMDSDLQHPPALIGPMYERWKAGSQVVNAIKSRTNRDSLFHELAAGIFYRTFERITGMDLTNSSDFKLLDREVVTAYLRMPERDLFFRGMVQWMGFAQESIEFQVEDRVEGDSSFTLSSLFRMATDVIVGSSGILLQGATVAGALSFVVCLVIAIKTVYEKAMGNAVEGFTTVILLQFIFGSVVLLGMGVMGLYVASIHRELKARPRFLIQDQHFPRQQRAQMVKPFRNAA